MYVCRLNSELEKIERNNAIPYRWCQDDQEYQECLRNLSHGKREVMLISLIKNRQRREFLLNLKRKYAGTY